MTCVLLALARDEGRFMDEWINYHLSIGFDHIHICDNNDKNNSIKINNSRVTVHDFTWVDFKSNGYNWPKLQTQIYNKILDDLYKTSDYCAICDLDEFFDFKGLNVKEFINKFILEKEYTVAEIAWEVYTDNNLIYTPNIPVQEAYTEICEKMPFNWCKNECSWGKSIFKLNKGIKTTPHWPEPPSMINFKSHHVDKTIACVKHYRTKSLEDYLTHKVKNQNFAFAPAAGGNIIMAYFSFNEVTLDKLIFILDYFKTNDIKFTHNDKEFIKDSFNKLLDKYF